MFEKAILVHVGIPKLDAQDLAEFHLLVESSGADIVGQITTTRTAPDAKFFIGSGKATELMALVKSNQADIVVIDHDLTPAQERNLEKLIQCRVIDRTGLILDIFAQRARTFEGKLQVELAQLQHLSTRLVRGWTHLERQKGGIGLRGPGETQLETDRRLIRERIKYINARLIKVKQQRQQSRQARQRTEVATLSLVGYTNAGKSTLFNALTQAQVYVADQLFATLDPTLRRIQLSHVGNLVLADTVGFIRRLPHDLVEAFQATLEETRLANLLLHVIDASHEHRQDTIHAVDVVLENIQANHVPQIKVFNKIDVLGEMPRIDYDQYGRPDQVWVSAKTGAGLDLLLQAITLRLSGERIRCCFRLSPKQSAIRARLHELNGVVSEHFDEFGDCLIEASLSVPEYFRLFQAS